MKRKRLVLIIAILAFILILSIPNMVKAADLKTELNIIQKSSETKYLENDQGFISKTIVDSNKNTGEVTIELKLSNTKKVTENDNSTEVFLVIDNSPSMDFVTANGKTRKEIVISSAKNLVNSLFENASNIKVGIIDFHGNNGWEGVGIQNATLRKKLTNDKNVILEDLEKLNTSKTVGGTNIDAGLQRAEKNFTSIKNNKVIILLTDGVPNADVKGTKAGEKTTDANSVIVHNNTKETLTRLQNSGINIISMMTGISEADGNTDKDGTEYVINPIEDDLKVIENIFGTTSAPTAGKFYLVQSADVSNIIEKDILSNVMEIVQNPINNVKIVDYFPTDITENFDFSYVGNPNVGTKSDNINNETNTIEWNIDALKGNEVATLKYKLKIKDMKNENLLNKTIATNKKVVLTYKDTEAKDYTVTLSSSPKIKLSEVKVVNPSTPKKDTTTAPGKMPQTGIYSAVIIATIAVAGIGIATFKKYRNLRDI